MCARVELCIGWLETVNPNCFINFKRGNFLLIQRQNGGTSSGEILFDGIFRGRSVKCSVSEGGGKGCVSEFVFLPVLVQLNKTLHVG